MRLPLAGSQVYRRLSLRGRCLMTASTVATCFLTPRSDSSRARPRPPWVKRFVCQWEVTGTVSRSPAHGGQRGHGRDTGGRDGHVPLLVSGAVSTFGTWAAPVGSEGLSLLVEVT